MRKFICSALVVAAVSLVATSCNKQAPKVDDKPVAATAANTEMKIAFIEVDSIMSQYKFCKEYSAILEKKGQNIQNTIASKGRSLQNAVAKFQQDIQNNKYTQQQAEAVTTCRNCSRGSARSSRLRPTSSTRLCATASSTILPCTTRTRNTL